MNKGPIILRIGLSFVFLWFGLNQIFDSGTWLSWLPSFAYSLFLAPNVLILINGIFETVLGLLLLMGLFTRVSALLLSINLFLIAFSLGYNDILIRDLGLVIATLSIWFTGPDNWCLDSKK